MRTLAARPDFAGTLITLRFPIEHAAAAFQLAQDKSNQTSAR
jgi:hypothetical protein